MIGGVRAVTDTTDAGEPRERLLGAAEGPQGRRLKAAFSGTAGGRACAVRALGQVAFFRRAGLGGEPAGRALHADAMHALTMTTKAIAALDRTAASAAATPSGSIVGWERDRIVARATAEQPLPFEIVRTSAPDGAKAASPDLAAGCR